jgi:hypothetical protein
MTLAKNSDSESAALAPAEDIIIPPAIYGAMNLLWKVTSIEIKLSFYWLA